MKNFIRQLAYLWGQLGFNQKVSLVFSVTTILVIAGAMLVWASRPTMQLLYGKLDNKDMAEIISSLDANGIQYKIQGSSVFVPSDKVYTMRMEMASRGIPNGGGVGFEIFDETKFGISDFVQKTNYVRAIQGELSRTIAQLQGVRSARVMVSVPENRLLAEQAKIRPTASVFVDTGGMRLTESSVNSIRFLIANSVEGLKVDDVAVVDSQGNVLSESLKGDGVLSMVGGGMRFKQSMEEYYSKKIETMLTPIVGLNNVVAKVSVTVNTDTAKMVEERFDPNGQVMRSQTVTEDSSTKDDVKPKPAAPAPANAAGAAASSGGQQVSTSKDNTKKKIIAYEISKSTTETVKGPGEVKEITAAVFVALKNEEPAKGSKEKQGKAVPRTPAEMDVIKKMIANAIGISSANPADIDKVISVQEVPFAKTDMITSTSILGSAYDIFGTLKEFGSIALALIMLLILFRIMKKHQPDSSIVELVDGGLSVAGGVGGEKNVTPKLTAELINELIKQKPENVGKTLKNWVKD